MWVHLFKKKVTVEQPGPGPAGPRQVPEAGGGDPEGAGAGYVQEQDLRLPVQAGGRPTSHRRQRGPWGRQDAMSHGELREPEAAEQGRPGEDLRRRRRLAPALRPPVIKYKNI